MLKLLFLVIIGIGFAMPGCVSDDDLVVETDEPETSETEQSLTWGQCVNNCADSKLYCDQGCEAEYGTGGARPNPGDRLTCKIDCRNSFIDCTGNCLSQWN
jgi:hypothetical protein